VTGRNRRRQSNKEVRCRETVGIRGVEGKVKYLMGGKVPGGDYILASPRGELRREDWRQSMGGRGRKSCPRRGEDMAGIRKVSQGENKCLFRLHARQQWKLHGNLTKGGMGSKLHNAPYVEIGEWRGILQTWRIEFGCRPVQME